MICLVKSFSGFFSVPDSVIVAQQSPSARREKTVLAASGSQPR
jgi:hypothetical protein